MKSLNNLLLLFRGLAINPCVHTSIKINRGLHFLLSLSLIITASLPLSANAASISLIISEVLYDPVGTEPDNEWIELYNLSGGMLDLSDFKVGDEETSGGGEGMTQFPGGTIAPGGIVVIANRADTFLSVYGFNPDYEFVDSDDTVPDMVRYTAWASRNVSFNNGSEEALILGSSDELVDAVSWAGSPFAFDPSAPSVAEGHSLEREFADIDTDSADDWFDQEMPSPNAVEISVNPVPIPAALWLFASGLLGLVGLARRRADINKR